jgi:hydrogenase maturation protease
MRRVGLPAAEPAYDTLVLGFGNLLWADEGFGVRCAEVLANHYEVPEGVRIMDGGTQGLLLVPLVRDARQVLVLDALDYRDPPGTLRIVRDGDIPSFLGINAASLHQVGFQDILAAIELMGGGPERITLVGVQAENMAEWGGGLTDTVAAMVETAVGTAVEELRAWGLDVKLREERHDAGLVTNDMDWAGYERRRAEV